MHQKRGIRPPGGYNFLVDNHGKRHDIRPIDQIPAHIYGYNTESVGICYSGGIRAGAKPNLNGHFKVRDCIDTRTIGQKVELVNTIIDVLLLIGESQPIHEIEIKGHRDFSPDVNGDGIIEPWEYMKQCPCFNAEPEYRMIFQQPALADLMKKTAADYPSNH